MRAFAFFSWLTDHILHLHGAAALFIVFLVPALEASAFVGFVFPGEIAVVLGGVIASHGTVPLPAVMAAAILGAFAGDAVGYYVGRRWGRQMLHGSIGRLPIIRSRLHKDLDAAQAFLERRGGMAVFIGRFTVALRILIPGLAGMSRIRYRTFALYNGLGAVVWGGGFAILGYLAGTAWQRVEADARWAGLGLLVLIVVGLIVYHFVRTRAARHQKDLAGAPDPAMGENKLTDAG